MCRRNEDKFSNSFRHESHLIAGCKIGGADEGRAVDVGAAEVGTEVEEAAEVGTGVEEAADVGTGVEQDED